jgi:tight adherence protein C
MDGLNLYTFWPWVIGGSITLLVWALISAFSDRTNRTMERLDELRDPSRRKREGEDGAMSRVSKAAPALAKALQPKTELEQNQLKTRLANGGFHSPNAPQLYLAIKLISLIVMLLIGGSLGFVKWGMAQNTLYTTVGGAALGLFLPEIILALVISSRKEKIFRSLPDALDLLVVCVEAGLGLDAAMRRVTEELKDTSPEVCEEFATSNSQLQIGVGRRTVLHDLGVRTGVDDMKSLAAILIQADKFGSSIAQALRVQSDSMRVRRRQLAEEKAQQTAVKLIFPLVLFIFPGIFVVLVGPAVIQISEGLLKTN